MLEGVRGAGGLGQEVAVDDDHGAIEIARGGDQSGVASPTTLAAVLGAWTLEVWSAPTVPAIGDVLVHG